MNFFLELFSSSGTVSSKRVIGTFTLLIVMGCVIYLTVTEGGTRAVEDLLSTAMLLAAGLLGISNITSIWKGDAWKHGTGNSKTQPSQSDCNCKKQYNDPGD